MIMESSQSPQRVFYPWLIWGLAAAFFFSEYFARVGPSVMVPELMRAFHVNALSLGALSGFFYAAYIAMQLPVGTLVDRYGPHRLLTVMAALCGASCFLFAAAHSIWMAELSRFLMGLTAAFAFVGTLKLATIWFRSEHLGLLAGLTQALGMLGAAVGEGPVALLDAQLGWRDTMRVMGVVLFILAILIGLIVRNRDRKQTTGAHSRIKINLLRALGIVIRNPQTWWNALFVGLLFAPTATFAELWGVTYLQRVHGISHQLAADAVSMVFVGWAVGGPLVGWLSDRIKRRQPVMMLSPLVCMLCILAVLYWHMPETLLFIVLFLYGMANTGVAISYAVAGEINPLPVAGTSIAFANMASVIVGACFQPITGWLLDIQWQGQLVDGIHVYSKTAYELALLSLPICLVLAFLARFKVRETHCKANLQGVV